MLNGILGIGSSGNNAQYPTAVGLETAISGIQAILGTYFVEEIPFMGIENKYTKAFIVGAGVQALYANLVLGYPLY